MNAPEKVTEIKAAIVAAVATLTALWGGVGWAVLIFLVCMVADYLSGSWAARAHGEWSSAVARAGLWHKLGEIVAILTAALTDIAIRVILSTEAAPLLGKISYKSPFTVAVCAWYTFTELGSILENAGKLGAPIPAWLSKGIAVLKNKADKAEPPAEEDPGEDEA